MKMRCVSLALMVFSTFCPLIAQQSRGPSTAEERSRFVETVKKLQNNPLDSSLKDEREWALLWLIQVPDVHASMCTDVLGSFLKSKYKYSPDITVILTLSSGKFSIEHPDQANDKSAMYLASVEGALTAYDSILKQQPDARSKPMDNLVMERANGKLAAVVENSSKKCK